MASHDCRPESHEWILKLNIDFFSSSRPLILRRCLPFCSGRWCHLFTASTLSTATSNVWCIGVTDGGRRGWGSRGKSRTKKTIREKYFSGNFYVKFGHFVIFHTYFFSFKNVVPPKVDWAPIRLWLGVTIESLASKTVEPPHHTTVKSRLKRLYCSRKVFLESWPLAVLICIHTMSSFGENILGNNRRFNFMILKSSSKSFFSWLDLI